MPFEDNINFALIGANVLLTLVLAVVYARNYKAIKSKFTGGLLVFALLFLFENLLDFYFYNSILEQSIYGLTTFNIGVNLIEMIALLVLAWITWK